MFEAARTARTDLDRKQSVRREIEDSIRGKTFMLTDVINADPDLSNLALEYLHGTGPDRRAQPVSVTIQVTAAMVKYLSVEMSAGGRSRTIGGSPRMDVAPDGRPLKIQIDPGLHTMQTAEATAWLLKHGEGTMRNRLSPIVVVTSGEINRIKCRELTPADAAMARGGPPSATSVPARRSPAGASPTA